MDTQDFLSFESCRSSVVDDMEEVSSKSSMKMQDKEETAPEASWAAVTGRKEKEEWRLDGVPVNPDGEGHREQAQVISSTREREKKCQVKRVRRSRVRKAK